MLSLGRLKETGAAACLFYFLNEFVKTQLSSKYGMNAPFFGQMLISSVWEIDVVIEGEKVGMGSLFGEI